MLKLNVGFTKKVGEANYGSRGASVNLELEFDSSLVGDSERLRERIKQLFVMAKTAVDEELTATRPSDSCRHGSDGKGHTGGRRRDGTRPATANQVRALGAIAEKQGLELTDRLHARFGVHDPAELTITEASGLIDELKETADDGDRR